MGLTRIVGESGASPWRVQRAAVIPHRKRPTPPRPVFVIARRPWRTESRRSASPLPLRPGRVGIAASSRRWAPIRPRRRRTRPRRRFAPAQAPGRPAVPLNRSRTHKAASTVFPGKEPRTSALSLSPGAARSNSWSAWWSRSPGDRFPRRPSISGASVKRNSPLPARARSRYPGVKPALVTWRQESDFVENLSIFDLTPGGERFKPEKSTDWKWRFSDYPREKNGLKVFSCFAYLMDIREFNQLPVEEIPGDPGDKQGSQRQQDRSMGGADKGGTGGGALQDRPGFPPETRPDL